MPIFSRAWLASKRWQLVLSQRKVFLVAKRRIPVGIHVDDQPLFVLPFQEGVGGSSKVILAPWKSIMRDQLKSGRITSDVGFLLVREIDDRFKIIDPMGECLEDLRSMLSRLENDVPG